MTARKRLGIMAMTGISWGGTMPKFILALAVITSLTGCAAIPFAVGAAGAVVADEAMERQNGDDGLF